MPNSWRKGNVISIYKQKGDVRSCGNYRSVKALEAWDEKMKVMERLFENHQKNIVKLDEMQMGFMPGRGYVNAIFILLQMLEKYDTKGNYTLSLLIWKNRLTM